MKSLLKTLGIILLLMAFENALAVDGFKEYKFGLTFEDAKKVNHCEWQKQDVGFSGFMISGNKRADLYKCNDYKYDGREIELYLEFIDNSLQRIILDISANQQSNLQQLERFKQQYGYKNGDVVDKGRSKQYSFDDTSVEVELYEPPLNLMYLRFYSKDYPFLIKQPYIEGLTT